MHDDQFTAMGPPFAHSGFPESGFSTLPEDPVFQFGLRANARRCGVMGQTGGGGVAGVYGHGRFSLVGVLGTAFGQSIGVVGTSVVTTNDLMNLNVSPDQVSLDSLGGGSGTGVLGKSGSGFGVHGTSDANTAVLGASGSGFGVHGVSGGGPGGVFESTSNAQIRMVPRELTTPEGHSGGAGGELLATVAAGPAGPEFRLWFCTRAGDAASATWDLVGGSRPFPGTPLSEGHRGRRQTGPDATEHGDRHPTQRRR